MRGSGMGMDDAVMECKEDVESKIKETEMASVDGKKSASEMLGSIEHGWYAKAPPTLSGAMTKNRIM